MSPEELTARVEQIRRMAVDDESAHNAEDRLYYDTLWAIREGADSPETLAAIAIQTKGIDFARWCA